ncbi:universal stress protein [Phormidium tenue FACHB-886]|nr:universal stress protein [Phormidium tenue FACHB-886]
MFQRPLICTDLNDGLNRLVNFIPSLAESGIKQITFLHGIPFPPGQTIPRISEEKLQESRDRLAVAQQNVPAGVQVKIDIQGGKPIDCILNAAKSHNPDLIVMGTPSGGGLGDRLFGSVIQELSKRKIAPLLILRPQLLSTYRVEELDLRCRHLFQHFLVPYDGSKPADYVVSKLKQLRQDSADFGFQQCSLCWVVEKGRYAELLESGDNQQIHKKLTAVQSDLEATGLEVFARVMQGEPVPNILKAAEEIDISAIACSSGSMGKLIEWSIPSFAKEILYRSWHPVLYFPPM